MSKNGAEEIKFVRDNACSPCQLSRVRKQLSLPATASITQESADTVETYSICSASDSSTMPALSTSFPLSEFPKGETTSARSVCLMAGRLEVRNDQDDMMVAEENFRILKRINAAELDGIVSTRATTATPKANTSSSGNGGSIGEKLQQQRSRFFALLLPTAFSADEGEHCKQTQDDRSSLIDSMSEIRGVIACKTMKELRETTISNAEGKGATAPPTKATSANTVPMFRSKAT